MAFMDGLIKEALGDKTKAGLTVAGLAGTAGLIGALHSTKKAKESSSAKAEANAEIIRDAMKGRKEHLAEYLINPAVHGPLSEVKNRLKRRMYASMAEHPMRTSMIPAYGLIRGGKAGEAKIKD